MKRSKIVRVWTDEAYRSKLNVAEHPAGVVELSGEQLTQVAGGVSANWYDGCRSIISCSALFSDCGGGGGSIAY